MSSAAKYWMLPGYIYSSYDYSSYHYFPCNVEKINEEQFPPKPKELDNTCLTGTSFRKWVSGIKGNSLIGVWKRRLG
jgi:hypothetical protein